MGIECVDFGLFVVSFIQHQRMDSIIIYVSSSTDYMSAMVFMCLLRLLECTC